MLYILYLVFISSEMTTDSCGVCNWAELLITISIGWGAAHTGRVGEVEGIWGGERSSRGCLVGGLFVGFATSNLQNQGKSRGAKQERRKLPERKSTEARKKERRAQSVCMSTLTLRVKKISTEF